MIRVYVADDHAMVRGGLRRILDAVGDITVVGEGDSGDAALRALSEQPVDVLLLDIEMPGMDFLTVLEAIKDRGLTVRVAIVSAHSEEQFAVRAFRAGAAAYLTKDRTPEELLAAVRRIYKGGLYVSESLAHLLATSLHPDNPPPAHEQLSNREFEALRLIATGKSLKQVAADMGINPKTVSTYRARILEKLRMETTADIVRYAVQHGVAGDGRRD